MGIALGDCRRCPKSLPAFRPLKPDCASEESTFRALLCTFLACASGFNGDLRPKTFPTASWYVGAVGQPLKPNEIPGRFQSPAIYRKDRCPGLRRKSLHAVAGPVWPACRRQRRFLGPNRWRSSFWAGSVVQQPANRARQTASRTARQRFQSVRMLTLASAEGKFEAEMSQN